MQSKAAGRSVCESVWTSVDLFGPRALGVLRRTMAQTPGSEEPACAVAVAVLERLPLCAFKLSFETELGNGAWKRSLETELGNVSTWHRWIQEELLWSTRRRTRFRTHPAANAVSHTHTADRRFEAHRHTDTPTYRHTDIQTKASRKGRTGCARALAPWRGFSAPG